MLNRFSNSFRKTQMTKVSIASIAAKVGVSKASVSLVLNGKQKEGRIGDALAQLIRETAKEMNYQPNELARSLRTGYSKTIGLIVADISNQFFSRLAYHIQEQADHRGYSVIFVNVSERSERMKPMIDVLRNKKVDGIIMVPTNDTESTIEELIASKYPLVMVDRYLANVEASHVVIDNYQAAVNATRYLIESGCKKITLFTHQQNQPHILERKKGFMDTLKEYGLDSQSSIFQVEYNNVDQEIRHQLTRIKEENAGNDGFLFTSSSISMSGIKNLLQLGFDINNPCKLVCFDYNEAYEFLNFKVPYVLQPIAEMGRIAVDNLINQIENQDFEIIESILDTQLIQ